MIERYLNLFSSSNLLFLNFDDLKENLDIILNNTCDFLEIDRFTSQEMQIFENTQYNVGKTKKLSDDVTETLELLQNYFVPFNKKLCYN